MHEVFWGKGVEVITHRGTFSFNDPYLIIEFIKSLDEGEMKDGIVAVVSPTGHVTKSWSITSYLNMVSNKK